ncbi:MAG: leucine-rich repeat protein [Prevotella sp.]|nr:leucine-rich repeat protein [Prevotella sp.]
MQLIENYKSVMTTKYSRFYGRASRSEFWYFILANVLFVFIPMILLGSLLRDLTWLITLVWLVYFIGAFIPSMAVSVRRLHDTNRSGWWLLLYLIPYIGALALLFMFISEGDYLANSYGNPLRIDEMMRNRGINGKNSTSDVAESPKAKEEALAKEEETLSQSLPSPTIEVEKVECKPADNASVTKSNLLPEGILSIGKSMFKDNKKLVEIDIPASVIEIEECAFSGCSRLSRVTFLGNSLKRIGKSAFWDCSSLSAIAIPDGVEEIGDDVFWGCDSITSAHLPDSVRVIGKNAYFQCDKLRDVVLPSGLTAISESMFNGCSSLRSIHIPPTVTSIGNEAFRDCESLESFTMPDSVTTIGNGIFCDCKSLSDVKISKNIESLGDSTFANCRSLTHIQIPNSVVDLGAGTFLGCKGLKSFTIPAQIKTIKSNPFQMIGLHKLICESPDFKVIGSALYNKSVSRIITCFTKDSYFEIPETVTTIGDFAFAYKMGLEEVKCPSTLKEIGRNAFYMCWGLKEINVDVNNVSIGKDAFADCSKLKKDGIRTTRELTDEDIEWAMMEMEAQADNYYNYMDMDLY